jgi:glutamate N-acetyltransferase/amino-acid N-acetyltransferase
MCAVLASGYAGNPLIDKEDGDYEAFFGALSQLMEHLAREVARDGEGATKLLTCTVSGADSEATAETLAKAVIASSLVKAAMFGSDANWGRVLCAMGYSGAAFDPGSTDVSFKSAAGLIDVAKNGRGLDFDETKATEILKQDEVIIDIRIGSGAFTVSSWGCDLSYDYVKINGDYRT